MKKSKFSDSQIMAILKQVEAGIPMLALCREHGMSNATFYKWRSKYGGMDTSMIARLKELEEENRQLKKMYAEERFKSELRKGGARKKVVAPWQRRDMAKQVVTQREISILLACDIYGISETCYRYQSGLSTENRIIDLSGNFLPPRTRACGLG